MVRSIVYIRKVMKASVVCSIRSLRSVAVFVHCKRPGQIGILETLQRYGAQCDTFLLPQRWSRNYAFRAVFLLLSVERDLQAGCDVSGLTPCRLCTRFLCHRGLVEVSWPSFKARSKVTTVSKHHHSVVCRPKCKLEAFRSRNSVTDCDGRPKL